MNNSEANKLSFSGQQADEFVISVIRPGKLILYANIAYKITFAILFTFGWWRANFYLPHILKSYHVAGYLVIFLITALLIWLKYNSFTQIKTYLTDRRLVKFDPTSPFSAYKRALFWKDVTKVRDNQEFSFWNIFKLGHVKIFSYESGNEPEMILSYIDHFEDLSSYIEKIIFNAKEHPENLSEMSPFEPNPAKRIYNT